MALGIKFPIVMLIGGVVLLNISSDKTVEHSVHVASALGVSPPIIGL